ncbi:MAG TPA: M1 family aminopeptidase [Casimicrobiaceae bacterium]|nr:M1 family aminopeptidase [Casimicrobiaceae bacterium]
MNAFLAIAAFEFRTRVARISTWVYFTIFAALAILWVAAAGGAIKGAVVAFGSGKVWINSPYAIAQTFAFLGLASLTVIAAVMGRAVQQDFEHRTEAFFFTAPIGKLDYLAGRFVGALGVLIVILSSIPLGSVLGLAWPGIDADRVGPVRPLAYLIPYATTLAPNVIVLGGFFFCLAALTRRMLPVYVASVVLLVGYLAAQGLLRDMDNKTVATLLDPFGVTAASKLVEYWSISERNARLVPLAGYLLWNRLAWLALAAIVIAASARSFRFAQPVVRREPRRPPRVDEDEVPLATGFVRAAPSRVRPWRLLPRMAWLNFRETVKNVYFAVIALAGVLFCITVSTTAGTIYGTTTWPVTYQILELVSGTFAIFMLVIVTFYAGELAWRERDARLDQIHDALPLPTWLPYVAKLVALMLVPVVLQAVLMLTGLGIQTAKGYHHYELGLYLRWLFGIQLVDYWLVCVLALTVQSLVNRKYLGHFVMIVYFIAVSFSGLLGFEHNLYKYGANGDFVYSDMNGFGPFLVRVRYFQSYWAAAAVLLALAGYLFWQRGTMEGRRARFATMQRRFTHPVALTGACALVAMATLGGVIFYNTNVRNPYVNAYDRQARQAAYEKRYKALETVPQPKIAAVSVDVDLHPREQRVRMKGRYTLENRTDAAIPVIHLVFGARERLVIHALGFAEPAKLVDDDMKLGVRSYRLGTPLAPEAKLELAFDLEVPTHGFTNSGATTDVVANGSFVNGDAVLPFVGYQAHGELVNDNDRKKFGLAPKERMRPREDPVGLAHNALATDADFIAFEATIATDADQYAIAPGYLQRDWMEGGRRHFTYRMDAPILDFFAVQSARYAVRKDRWHDVAIEIYYQPGHEYDLDRMIAATKAGLDYFTANFGPYQYRQFRIVEFPRYATFAQSFPNTVPYSEGIGFIARVRDDDPKDIDYPYYVTAHELAHQWWGHQVPGANVRGNTMLVETLAQYSALMVMKQKYGAAKMQRFLRYELDRYLIGRGTEQKKELPLSQVENQDYIHYRKGSLVMYALADYIGEDNVNRALRAYRDKWAFKGPPYSTTKDLLAEIRAVTPSSLAYLIGDFFDTITFYDNRALTATARRLPDDRYEVTLTVSSRKSRADDLGKETDVPLNELVDVGVLDEHDAPLLREKRRISTPNTTLSLIVAGKPARAGIDPFNELIDRQPKDNTVAVTVQ